MPCFFIKTNCYEKLSIVIVVIKVNFSSLCSLGSHDKDIKSASMNNEGDKIIVTDKNGKVIMCQKK